MNPFYDWARRWNVPEAAVIELIRMGTPMSSDPSEGSESLVQSMVRLEARDAGIHLWRNNVGAGRVVHKDDADKPPSEIEPRPIRWGLCNDSSRINKVMKSGDLIGIKPVLIQPHHVGYVIGQFVSRECKEAGWTWKGTPREQAQLNWMMLIQRNGGDAQIVNGLGSFK